MYYSMDQIIDYIESRNGRGGRYEGVTIQYAMLEDYFQAVHLSSLDKNDVPLPHTSDQTDVPLSNTSEASDVVGNNAWSVRDEGDFLPYNTLNCAGASQNFTKSCSGNAGMFYLRV